MITITMNDDYTLTADSNIIPCQYSSSIPFHLELPEIYKNSLIVPGYIYWDGSEKIENAVTDYKDGNFTVPSNAFSHDGMLGIAFAITSEDKTETTEIVDFEVRSSIDTSFSLPSEEIWQEMLQNFMDQYMYKTYSKIMDDLIKTTADLQEGTKKLQKDINAAVKDVETAYSNLGDFKVENGMIYFKKADGSWNTQGVALAGQSTINLDNVVQTNLKLATQRNASATKVKVQLQSEDGKALVVETTADQVNLMKSNGDEIGLKTMLSTIASFAKGVSFYDTTEAVDAKNKLLEFMEVN